MEELNLIRERFIIDVENITRYTSLTLHKFGRVSWRDIEDNLMHVDDVKTYCESIEYERSKMLEVNDIKQILEIISREFDKQVELSSALNELAKSRSSALDDPKMEKISDLLRYLLFDDVYETQNILNGEEVYRYIFSRSDEFYKLIFDNQEDYFGEMGFHDYYDAHKSEVLEVLCKRLKDLIVEELATDEIDVVDYGIDFMHDLEELYRILEDESQLNVYKQSFILVMANFDAVIFDITEKFLDKHFFKYVSYFNSKNDESKLDLGKFSKYNDFDDFKKSVISEVLSTKYATTIVLKISEIENCNLLDDGQLKKILENFDRRNVHLHHKGFVDDKYKIGRSLFNLRVGDYTVIDEGYYNSSKDLLLNYVTNYCEWIKNI